MPRRQKKAKLNQFIRILWWPSCSNKFKINKSKFVFALRVTYRNTGQLSQFTSLIMKLIGLLLNLAVITGKNFEIIQGQLRDFI
ncbi:hypothetical protein CVS40_4798 [Lucilia cuprina]|nr:hypothetical protein CVS40_4798 [Lucilia cuprina]